MVENFISVANFFCRGSQANFKKFKKILLCKFNKLQFSRGGGSDPLTPSFLDPRMYLNNLNINNLSCFTNKYKHYLSFLCMHTVIHQYYDYKQIIEILSHHTELLINTIFFLFLSKQLIMSLTFGIVFNIEGYLLSTIKGRDDRVPICSHCRFLVQRTVKPFI